MRMAFLSLRQLAISTLITAAVIGGAATASAQGPQGSFEQPIDPGTTSIDALVATGDPLVAYLNVILKIIIGVIGVVGVIVIIIAGYVYMTAGGNAAQVGKAKIMIGGALGGIVLALLAYLLLDTLSPQFASQLRGPNIIDNFNGGGGDFGDPSEAPPRPSLFYPSVVPTSCNNGVDDDNDAFTVDQNGNPTLNPSGGIDWSGGIVPNLGIFISADPDCAGQQNSNAEGGGGRPSPSPSARVSPTPSASSSPSASPSPSGATLRPSECNNGVDDDNDAVSFDSTGQATANPNGGMDWNGGFVATYNITVQKDPQCQAPVDTSESN